jgi:hypothetical protein
MTSLRAAGFLVATVAFGGLVMIPAGAGTAVPARQSFEIRGEVDGLFPGVTETLDARVTSRENFTMTVTTVGATVRDATPTCPGSFLTVEGSRARVDVLSGATASIPLVVHMDRAAPDACQGVTFPLEFRATVVADRGVTDATASGELAFTGATIASMVGIALALVGAGVVLLRGARRRAEQDAR